MTAERIAAAIKPIIDEDRRADRVRIAELERDAAHFASVETTLSNWQTIIDDLNKELDELNEKCAALVVENKRLREDDDDPERKPLDVAAMNRVLDECGVAKPQRYDNSTLRIDPDMSDPQPGKLLVVRLDDDDVGRGWVELGDLTENGRGKDTQNFWPEQRVGFLVETPAVEVKEQGPWVIQSDGEYLCYDNRGTTRHIEDAYKFATRAEAQERMCLRERIITLAEARAIEAKR